MRVFVCSDNIRHRAAKMDGKQGVWHMGTGRVRHRVHVNSAHICGE
jgi:hypothetical protein